VCCVYARGRGSEIKIDTSEEADGEDLCEAGREAEADRTDDRHVHSEQQHWPQPNLCWQCGSGFITIYIYIYINVYICT